MGSIIAKRFNGRTYYYLAESRRVGGRPRIVAQRYLGTAEEIETSLGGVAAEPERTRHLAFGSVAAVWRTIERLRLAETVDEIVGRQRTKVSVGTYTALAVLHRVAAPGVGLAQWWETTAADRFIRPPLAAEAFEHARFWRAMRRLGTRERQRIEASAADSVRQSIAADTVLPMLIVDVPNFTSLVGPEGLTDPLAGVSLVVSKAGAIPLLSRDYLRGRAGGASFGALAARHRELLGPSEITAVFDAGQHAQLDLDFGAHFVGGLPPGDYPELLVQPATVRSAVDQRRFPGLSALDTRAVVYGVRRRVILTHSANLRAAQARGMSQALNHATRQLDGLADALVAGTYRPTGGHLVAEIARITRVRWVDKILLTRLEGTKPGKIRLRWQVDEAARAKVEEEFFGKQLLVTDHEDWPVADVITAYRARYHLDSTFRRLSEPLLAHPPPNWRWTEERVAVYHLISVLAATVMHLMRHEANEAGLDLSVRELFEHLAGIQETWLRYPSTGGRPRTRRVLTDRTEVQQRLFDLFGLENDAPHRVQRNKGAESKPARKPPPLPA